jgi:hypothetical protein
MLSAYEVNVMYPTSGLGQVIGRTGQPIQYKVSPRLDPAKIATIFDGPSGAGGAAGTSTLVLVGAIAGAGILAYVAAKALKK